MVEKSKMVAKKNVGHIQGEHHFQDGHNIQDDSKNRMMTTTLKLFIMSKMVPHQIKILVLGLGVGVWGGAWGVFWGGVWW